MIANALWFTVAMLALVAPGVLVTRALGLRERFILGVAVGPVALFQICFLIYLGGVSIRFTPVLIGFVAVCIALALVKPRNVAATSLGRNFAFSKLSLVDGLILLGGAWVACM